MPRRLFATAAACVCALALCGGALGQAAPGRINLAQDGKTTYQVVTPSSPLSVDEYAARELAGYLAQITGAEFPVVAPSDMTAGRESIFVGLSEPALKLLGPDPLASLKDQEHVTRSIGRDILLYGKGVHGNLNAVFAFLEDFMGWRWFSLYEHPVIPSRPSVALDPFNRKMGFSFARRQVSVRKSFDYCYQNGVNMGYDARIKQIARRNGEDAVKGLRAFVSAIPEDDDPAHSLFSFVPPQPKAQGADRFPWLERRNYFETNPEFFSMWDHGKRLPDRQFCFSCLGLRKELTKNVLRHVDEAGGEILVKVTAMDVPGAFCYCPQCKALEQKYQSPGGPYYDYLLELSAALAAQSPKARIVALAYRRVQTQKPPVLPGGGRLPDNLIIDFAGIDDCYFADWNHPDPSIQDTYRDLVAWGKLTDNLWAWMYPNPWGSGIAMPVGNIERNINNLRLLAKAGVVGVYTDHSSFMSRGGLSEIQQYVLLKLMKDVDRDAGAIVREITDSFYGPAAPLMRKYLDELEQGRKAMATLPKGVNYRSPEYNDATFPYLTVENIRRWQTYFDEMEKLLDGQPERLLVNVRLVRRHLDLATLWKWRALSKAHPKEFTDYTVCVGRITAANKAKPLPPTDWEQQTGKAPGRIALPLGEGAMQDFVTLIQCGGEEKPLPEEFKGIAPAGLQRLLPKYSSRRSGRGFVPDPDAAFGYGVPVHNPDLPLQAGFYQNDTKTHGERLRLEPAAIQPGVYKLHKLGVIDVTPDCVIWFSARSWSTQLQLGERLYEPGADNHWTAYVSIKCDGPSYGAAANEKLLALADRKPYAGVSDQDLVLVDQIILVRQTPAP